MDAPMDSDEEDSFVTLGRPLEIYDDDEARKKPVSVHDLPAKDSHGRTRFHGAFTGGFSAGFFNTVGSKEGFRPSSFLSSRSSKGESVAQRPEDFMDDEDFCEHGIAPRKLATSSTYTSEERGRKRKVMTAAAVAGSSLIPGVADALTDLIIPDSVPIGVSLLRKMGWKEGQGVGPRARRKRKKKDSEVKKAPSLKVYGCALPQSGSSEEESDDEALQNITFAPKDRNPVSLKAKDNVHGLGYSGLNPRNALPSGHINLFSPPVKGKGHRGIQGHAFGVGALEDDDEDIYATDHMSNYDMTMGSEEKDDKFGWTAPGHCEKGKQHIPIGYIGKLLEGFRISSKSLKPKKVFRHPPLPPGFRLVHTFLKPRGSSFASGSTDKHNAISRGLVLGETPIFQSVFDLIPKDDQKKLERAKDPPLPGPHSSQQTSREHLETSPGETSGHTPTTAVGVAIGPTQTMYKGNPTFQPFARDQDKQRRYDKYLSNFRQGNKDLFEEVVEGSMTEWEKEREKEEFARAAKLYKPLSTMMASRFTSARYTDDLDTAEMPADPQVEQSDQAKAVEMKMFGQLTREQLEWHPDKLLCQRFNVPYPYPGSTITGLTSVKRDKYSVFNFLEFSGAHAANTEQPSADPEPVKAIESKESVSKQITSDSVPQKRGMKSFMIGNKSSVKPAFSSIFSVLYEDDDKKQKAKQAHMEQERVMESVGHQNKERGETQRDSQTGTNISKGDSDLPSMDLFKAVFKNSDSEDSSSESEQDQSETQPEPVAMEVSSSEGNAEMDIGDGKLPVTQDTNSHTRHYLPGAPVAIETVPQRLSPLMSDTPQSEDEMAYGPALPPPQGSGNAVSATASSCSQADLTHAAHRQHRQKHKDRDSKKHKNEKKAKYKKSKHKKEKKKRKKKKKTERKVSSTEDSDTSGSKSDTVGSSDHQLLERLKSLEGSRLKAADFM